MTGASNGAVLLAPPEPPGPLDTLVLLEELALLDALAPPPSAGYGSCSSKPRTSAQLDRSAAQAPRMLVASHGDVRADFDDRLTDHLPS
ncbi:Hypothetical protein A7982_04691 [Minicystis rosea]|nr:Hypothetical protein A7982_04691 [Minicystis rosea]